VPIKSTIPVDVLISLREDGLALREIGQRVGLTASSVGKKLKAAGVDTSRKPAPTSPHLPELIRLHKRGFAVGRAAAEVGISREWAGQLLLKAGYSSRIPAPPDEHGTVWTANRGCLCSPCRTALHEQQRNYRGRQYNLLAPLSGEELTASRSGATPSFAEHSPACYCTGCQDSRVSYSELEDIGVDTSAEHGTFDRYFLGCDCVPCSEAYRNRIEQ